MRRAISLLRPGDRAAESGHSRRPCVTSCRVGGCRALQNPCPVHGMQRGIDARARTLRVFITRSVEDSGWERLSVLLRIAMEGHMAKPMVLVVDDQPEYARLISLSLAREGFEVRTAGGGEEAVDRASELH